MVRFPSYFSLAFIVLLALLTFYFTLGLYISHDFVQLGPNVTNTTLAYVKASSITVANPIITGDRPDPGVIRTRVGTGVLTYYLSHTIHNGLTSRNGDFPIFTSTNLAHWSERSYGAFNRTKTPADGPSLRVNTADYCTMWAPEIFAHDENSAWFMLSYTATRHVAPVGDCYTQAMPANLGVYNAYTNDLKKGFAWTEHPWEPIPAGASFGSCAHLHYLLPHSPDYYHTENQGCNGQSGLGCSRYIRLDSNPWKDPQTGRTWMAYTWITNHRAVPADRPFEGNDVSIVEVETNDPFVVKCDVNVSLIHAGIPHDNITLERLRTYCPRCGEMLSMTKDRWGNDMYSEGGHLTGVNEAPSLFRRGDYVYLLMSGSSWDSPYYNVFWVAAPTVEELRYDNPNRLVGRYLIPNRGESFGHGSAILGPDNRNWYFVHHRLNATRCQQGGAGACDRDIWISPIEFQDCANGGPRNACIKARFPAEQRTTTIIQPLP